MSKEQVSEKKVFSEFDRQRLDFMARGICAVAIAFRQGVRIETALRHVQGEHIGDIWLELAELAEGALGATAAAS